MELQTQATTFIALTMVFCQAKLVAALFAKGFGQRAVQAKRRTVQRRFPNKRFVCFD